MLVNVYACRYQYISYITWKVQVWSKCMKYENIYIYFTVNIKNIFYFFFTFLTDSSYKMLSRKTMIKFCHVVVCMKAGVESAIESGMMKCWNKYLTTMSVGYLCFLELFLHPSGEARCWFPPEKLLQGSWKRLHIKTILKQHHSTTTL